MFIVNNNNIHLAIENYYNFFDYILYSVVTLVPLLIVIAIFTLAERRVMASIQRRKGPNVVGIWGFLQPFSDALKLVMKEIIIPSKSNKFLFIFAPSFVLFLSLLGWIVISFDIYTQVLSINHGILYLLVISSFGVYGILLAGWSSNSKYALFGALRSVAQMISYEISISLSLLPAILLCSSLNLNILIYTQIVTVWFIAPLLPVAVIYFISILAETNRTPFDLAEAEAELVAGYNVEYSGILFVAFFLGEYSNILLMSSIFVCLFLGGSDILLNIQAFSNISILTHIFSFSFKIVIVSGLFIFIRANLPRFRFDQLMYIGWKVFVPILLSFLILTVSLLFTADFTDISQAPLKYVVTGFSSLSFIRF